MNAWRTISVALQASTAGYVSDLRAAGRATEDFGRRVDGTVKSGDRTFKTFGDRIKGIAGSIGDWVRKLGPLAAGLTGVGVATRVITGGYRRMTMIQDATAALTISLGDATAAANLLDQVMDTVTGTPYRFEDFAAAAQQMVGMGVSAEKVPKYLEAIGEAAATQGGRAQEFAGRLSTIFGQMAAASRVTMQDINRISETGVNALVILGNEFGVSTVEMRKMVSQGIVPADRAMDALATGIIEGSKGAAGETAALGGTMEALRDTVSGSVGGIASAMDRLGAAILEPFSDLIVSGARGLTDLFDGLSDVVSRFAGPLADALENIVTLAGEVFGAMEPLINLFSALTESAVLKPLETIIGVIGDLAGYAAESRVAVHLLAAAFTVLVGAKVVSGIADLQRSVFGLVEAFRERIAVQRFASAMGDMQGKGSRVASGFGAAAGKLAVFTAAIGLATYMWDDYRQAQRRVAAQRNEIVDAILETGDAIEIVTDKVARAMAGLDDAFVWSGGGTFGIDLDPDVMASALESVSEKTGMSIREIVTLLAEGEDAYHKFLKEYEITDLGEILALGRITTELEKSGASAGKYQEILDATGKGMDALTTAGKKFIEIGNPFINLLASGDLESFTPNIYWQDIIDGFDEVSEAISGSRDELSAWADLVDTIIGVPKDWADAHREWIGSLDDLGATLRETAGDTDLYTEAGRETHKAVSDQVDSAWKAAEAFGAQGNGAEDAANMLAFMREQLINTIVAEDMSRESAEKLVDQYGLTEEALWLLSSAAQDGKIKTSDLSSVMNYLAEQGGNAKIEIDKAGEAVIRLPSGKTVTVDVFVQRQRFDQLLADIRSSEWSLWSANPFQRRWGGIDRYATGGIRQAMTGSGKNLIWWDEPETGGEAYIPRLGRRDLSIPVLAEAAGWYGMQISPMRDGGTTMTPYTPINPVSSTSSSASTYIGTVNIGEDDIGMTRSEVKTLVKDLIRGEL